MKYLTHYTQEAQTELFDNCGAFFAFSNLQLNDKKIEGVEYVSLRNGLICPKNKVDELLCGLEFIQSKGIEADIAENGKEAIIDRELANHEVQITGDFTDVIDALDGYSISEKEIIDRYPMFYEKCIDNDWF